MDCKSTNKLQRITNPSERGIANPLISSNGLQIRRNGQTKKLINFKTQNMLLTKQLYTTGITLIAALLLSACQKENLPIADGNKTVNITLSTKVGGDGSSAASAEDAIHTLRIYAFYGDDNELIGYHYEDNIPSLGTYSFSMPLNLSYKEDFPDGSVMAKFYVVANEGGVTIKKEQNQFVFPTADFESGELKWAEGVIPTSPEELSALLITDYGTKTEGDIKENGLPMSYKDDYVKITTETNQSLVFGMERAVVKLNAQFHNDGLETTVNKISFGNFQADKGYLFEQGGDKIVPEDARYSTYTTSDDYSLTIGAGEDKSVCFYQLPSAAGGENYTVGFSHNKKTFDPALLNQSSIKRNTQLDIMVTLKTDRIIFGVPKVNPWETATGGIIIVE